MTNDLNFMSIQSLQGSGPAKRGSPTSKSGAQPIHSRINHKAARKNAHEARAASMSVRNIKTKPNMQLTLTQSGALYLAQHKISKRRSALFRQLRAAGRKQSPDLRQQTLVDASFVRRFHRDNGR